MLMMMIMRMTTTMMMMTTTTMNNNNNNNNNSSNNKLQKQPYRVLHKCYGQALMQKYKTHFMGEITLHVAQIVNTEQLQHCITRKSFFQVYNCKYPAQM